MEESFDTLLLVVAEKIIYYRQSRQCGDYRFNQYLIVYTGEKKTMKSQIIIYTRALPRSSLSTMAMIGSAYRPESSTPRNFLMSSL